MDHFAGALRITKEALRWNKSTTVRAFLRKAGYAPVNDALLHSPNVQQVTGEGCQFFRDTDDNHCMAYNAYHDEDVARAVALASEHTANVVAIEYYRGPAYPEGVHEMAVQHGNVSIHRPRVVICRVHRAEAPEDEEGSDDEDGEVGGDIPA